MKSIIITKKATIFLYTELKQMIKMLNRASIQLQYKYKLMINYNIIRLFQMIYTYENLLVAYFPINERFCLVSLGNPTFSNIFPRVRHVLMTFGLWTLCARLCIFSLYISHLLLSSQQASITMWTILISKSWWRLPKPKR